ncbi:hypothetical protein, partial [Klebsiella variicola]
VLFTGSLNNRQRQILLALPPLMRQNPLVNIFRIHVIYRRHAAPDLRRNTVSVTRHVGIIRTHLMIQNVVPVKKYADKYRHHHAEKNNKVLLS